MTEQAISPLRRRMIEDMTIRKFAPKTQHDYVQRVKDFAAFLGRSPDTAKSEDVRRFRLHLASSGVGTPKINATVSALRFFFKVTLDRPDLAKHLAFMHEPRKVPVVLSPEEVARLSGGGAGHQVQGGAECRLRRGAARFRGRLAEGLRYRLRAHDAARRAGQGPQGSPRDAVAACCSSCCATGGASARPQGWLFPGQNPVSPMSTRQLTRACHAAAPDGRDHQARVAAHVAAQLRHPPARAEHRYPGDPGSARSCQARDHGALHPRRHQHDPRGHEPAGSPHAAEAREDEPEPPA